MTMLFDRCAACFETLRPSPSGGRYACDCKPPGMFKPLRGRYWSQVEPEDAHTMSACLVSRYGLPTLHLYGSIAR